MQELLRFLLAGLINNLLTIFLYQLFLVGLSAPAAFALSWIAGIIFVIKFYPEKVFKRRQAEAVQRFGLVVLYASSFLLGLGAMMLLEARMSRRLSILVVLVFTTIVNFLGSKLLLSPSSDM